MIIAAFGHWSVIHFLHLLQDAICTLNTLQTNASALEQVRRERGHPQLQLQAMTGFLERAGLMVSYSYHLTSQTRRECYIKGTSSITKIYIYIYALLSLKEQLFSFGLPACQRWRILISSISFM